MQQALRGRKLPLQIEYENILGVDFHFSLRHQKATPAGLQPSPQQKKEEASFIVSYGEACAT